MTKIQTIFNWSEKADQALYQAFAKSVLSIFISNKKQSPSTSRKFDLLNSHTCFRCLSSFVRFLLSWSMAATELSHRMLGLLILQDSVCDLLFVLCFPCIFTHLMYRTASTILSFIVCYHLNCFHVQFCVSILPFCVSILLVHPEVLCFLENHKGEKINTLRVHLQPGGSRFSLQGLLLTILKVFYHTIRQNIPPPPGPAPAIHGNC